MLYPQIDRFIKDLDTTNISKNRQQDLVKIANAIRQEIAKNQKVNLNFICTHNSRRSQFAQAWMHTLADFYDLNIYSFSGGVETTACDARTIETLKKTGFNITSQTGSNPEYFLTYNDSISPIRLYSKRFDDTSSPNEFLAIMTCDHADLNCPYIPNAIKRLSLNYSDPKVFDDTPKETEAYRQTSQSIAAEIKFILNCI